MVKAKPEITIPYNFTPRFYQKPFLKAMDNGLKRAVLVWHRRAGKDKTTWNFLIKRAFERVGIYYYFFPSYTQGKKILWDGIDKDGFKLLDHIPKRTRDGKPHETEMKITLINGSVIQLVGTDNIDSIVGTNPIGCVFSEYSIQDPKAWQFVRPILAENGGWAVFIYTPRGKNHGHDIFKVAQNSPEWFAQKLTVNDTKVLKKADIQRERDEGLSEEMIQQEYFCSFNAPLEGAYYAAQTRQAEEDGRFTSVPYDNEVKVDTYWDLGIADSTVIWFIQQVGKEIHVIDFYENQGEPLTHYIKELKEKNYVYGDHWAPHDIKAKELVTGKSRYEVAQALGLDFRIVNRIPVEDGIDAVRRIFNKCWFDQTKCDLGIQALQSYHKEWDERSKVFKKRPKHDWSSHAADAFRGFAVSFQDIIEDVDAGTDFNLYSNDYA